MLLEQIPTMAMEDPHACSLQAELLIRDTVALVSENFFEEIDNDFVLEFMSALEEVALAVREFIEEEDGYCFCLMNVTRGRGRPSIIIPEEQLQFLKKNNFKNSEIAKMLLVSPRTISRHLHYYGLEAITDNLSDDQLDTLAADFVRNNPFSGQKSFERFLRSNSLKVQRSRIIISC